MRGAAPSGLGITSLAALVDGSRPWLHRRRARVYRCHWFHRYAMKDRRSDRRTSGAVASVSTLGADVSIAVRGQRSTYLSQPSLDPLAHFGLQPTHIRRIIRELYGSRSGTNWVLRPGPRRAQSWSPASPNVVDAANRLRHHACGAGPAIGILRHDRPLAFLGMGRICAVLSRAGPLQRRRGPAPRDLARNEPVNILGRGVTRTDSKR